MRNKMEKCKCGSVQFKYNGDCLACGLTKEERELLAESSGLNHNEEQDLLANSPSLVEGNDK